MFPGFKS
jgi:hypothetical protein